MDHRRATLFVAAFLWSVCGVRYLFDGSSTEQNTTRVCVGSHESCEGDTCCPGYPGSEGLTFPCPSASSTFHGCAVDTRYDLYNASLMDFSNVVTDKLSADTEETGEALISGVAWWSGLRLDLYVQSVDAMGNLMPFRRNTFKKFKPQENGRLLSFQFQGRSSGYFRFNFGSWEDETWTPFVMPWLTLTLMDIDCGGPLDQCETVTSLDHTSFHAGGEVRVTQLGNTAVFRNTEVSGEENNPTSVLLTDEQRSTAVSLYFENRSSFTLRMANDARFPRIFLVSGITNMQWPSIHSPAPAPIPTERSSLPASALTAPSPACPFSLVSGNCEVNCLCMSSPNFPENYGADAACVVGVASAALLEVKDFATEVFWDALSVNGENFFGTDGPDGVIAEGEIAFNADGTDHDRGWHICAAVPTPNPTPEPTPSPPTLLQVEGPCEVSDGQKCVQSPHYPAEYDDYEHCIVRFAQHLTLHIVDFTTEKNSDTLTVDGMSLSGNKAPKQVHVTPSSLVEWSSDWGTAHSGWRMCTDRIEAKLDGMDPYLQQVAFEAGRTLGRGISYLYGLVGVVLGLIMFWVCSNW